MRMVRNFLRRLAGLDPVAEKAAEAKRERQQQRLDFIRDARAAKLEASSKELQRALHEMQRKAERV